MNTQGHIGELELRRLRAGELEDAASQQARAHTEACNRCRALLRSFDDEQRQFEQEISFERFSAGVQRAVRRPAEAQPPRGGWLYPVMAAAAMVTLMVSAGPLQRYFTQPGFTPMPMNRTKGADTGLDVKVKHSEGGHQRTASAEVPEPLAPGEQVMIGFRTGSYPYVMLVSIDERGAVSPIYPSDGRSIPVTGNGKDLEYLPGALEFDGKGLERVIVLLSREQLELSEIEAAAQRAYQAADGDVTHMPTLDVPAETLHQTFLKP